MQLELKVEAVKVKMTRLFPSMLAGKPEEVEGTMLAYLVCHGSMIGVNTGKVLSYAVRCKKCRFRDRAVDKENPNEHDCRKNWTKSSKAMESDMAVEMLSELKSKGFHVKKLIMDNDTTTISRKILKFQPYQKNVTNKLYSLRKEEKYNNLGPKAINHLTKCFAYAVKGSEDAASMKKNLEAIPRHVFGDHSRCSEWCGFVKSPSTYKPTSLPYGKYMAEEDLQLDLTTMFEEYAANSEKLLKVGSTQTNESFNHTVATKNPKTNFYSASESTSFRVAAAVAHKNIGLQTFTRVYENSLLSPGKHTNSYISKASRKRDYQKIVKSSVECKKRRRELISNK
ncbi:uncharacterized protein LOC133182561 [Saccostrea echinata]|uniref:uncharacterized protein LOC133182561 n=1 Tax=Saccostrea echinata TaxID=191078 RepID=UPI002A7FEE35|nr:uncharacterized protein LOC133182561 [Saccostrea echinata]